MRFRRRAIVTGIAITILAAQPAVAWAGTQVSGSYLTYLLDGTPRNSGTYAGSTGGRIRVCADQVGSAVGFGGSIAYIKRDISGLPDTTNSSLIVEGGRSYSCSSYTSSSSGAQYYTRVQPSVESGGNSKTGYARAERP
jgi:hypothetical protein